MKRKTGYFLAGLGSLVAFLALTIDLLGIGQAGIQSAQILGIQIGIVVALFGVGLARTVPEEEQPFFDALTRSCQRCLNAPIFIWILAGFFIIYMLFFIFPAFFNEDSRMFYFFRYIPDRYPAGSDLLYNTSAIQEWLRGNNPYTLDIHFYTPFYHVAFAPILLLGYPNNFYLITSLTLSGFVFITFILPFLLEKGRDTTVILFFLLTGLFSYGIQFELERGQFNVIAFALCGLAIYLFYYQPAFKYLAYFLFSVSIHLKLYPAIFIVMFIKDWKDWKNNLKRLAGLFLFNVLLLFITGPDMLVNFFQALRANSGPAWTFPGNHSITAFVYNLTHTGYGPISPTTMPWLKSMPLELILIGGFFVCFILVFAKTCRNNSGTFDPDLFLVCTLGALMLPSVSIDYKLELIAAPMALAFANRERPEKTWQKIVVIAAILVAAMAYALTLVPYKYRLEAGMLVNGFPMLFAILVSITIVSFIAKRKTLLPAPLPATHPVTDLV